LLVFRDKSERENDPDMDNNNKNSNNRSIGDKPIKKSILKDKNSRRVNSLTVTFDDSNSKKTSISIDDNKKNNDDG